MNRAERRRELKLGVSPQSVMEKYRREAYEAGWHDGMNHELEITFNILSYTLTYKTGYSKKRIKQLLHDLYFNVDSFRTRSPYTTRLRYNLCRFRKGWYNTS